MATGTIQFRVDGDLIEPAQEFDISDALELKLPMSHQTVVDVDEGEHTVEVVFTIFADDPCHLRSGMFVIHVGSDPETPVS